MYKKKFKLLQIYKLLPDAMKKWEKHDRDDTVQFFSCTMKSKGTERHCFFIIQKVSSTVYFPLEIREKKTSL